MVGYRFGGERVDFSAGAFNGRIDKAGDDDAIGSFVASVATQPFEMVMI